MVIFALYRGSPSNVQAGHRDAQRFLHEDERDAVSATATLILLGVRAFTRSLSRKPVKRNRWSKPGT
jgi:hypothetical protein